MRLDILIASASAGLLVYSGFLLVPLARSRPEDSTFFGFGSFLPSSAAFSAESPSSGMSMHSEFAEDQALPVVREVIDSKVGVALLAIGTIGGVFATIAGAFLPFRHISLGPNILAAVIVFVLGLVVGRVTNFIWHQRQEVPYVFCRFFAWLEWVVGDPKAKHYDFHLTVISTARYSGFKPLNEFLKSQRPDEMAIARWIANQARTYGYAWQRDDFGKWAGGLPSEDSPKR